MAAIAQVDPDETDSEEAERQLEDVIEYLRLPPSILLTKRNHYRKLTVKISKLNLPAVARI